MKLTKPTINTTIKNKQRIKTNNKHNKQVQLYITKIHTKQYIIKHINK